MGELQRDLDWNGEAYDRLSDLQYSYGMELLDTRRLRGDELVLDAGCGSGRITREILARLPRGAVIGVDLSERMLETARRTVIPRPGQRAEFLRADLQQYRPRFKVDGIFSNMALHFVADHHALFENFGAALVPGGWLALQYGSRHQAQPLSLRLMEVLKAPPYAEHLRAPAFVFAGGDAESDERALADTGFVDVQLELIEGQGPPDQVAKMREFLQTTVVEEGVARMPSPLREPFRREVEAALDVSFGKDFRFEYLRVRAQRPLH